LTFAPRIGYILQALKPYFILLERAVVEYNIGSKIKELRKARKLTLQDVARETGFSPALISQIENNNVSPPIATLSKIARFFDVKKSAESSQSPAPGMAILMKRFRFASVIKKWSLSWLR
jgi:transcriptional regulator with XRE-family HTH domain